MNLQPAWELLSRTVRQSLHDNIHRLGAALAFFGILSLAPLVLSLLALATTVFGADVARDYILSTATQFLTGEGIDIVKSLVAPSDAPAETKILVIVANSVVLLFGATGVFNELQDSFNTIWKVSKQPGRAIYRIVEERLFSFMMVFGTGLMMLISVVVGLVLSAITEFTVGFLPVLAVYMQGLQFGVGFGIATVLFAVLFKIMPDTHVSWRDVWVGAIVTAFLFTIGQLVISYYLGHSGIASRFGAAGSIVALLVWIYYTAQILFFGAEMTYVYACRSGSRSKKSSA